MKSSSLRLDYGRAPASRLGKILFGVGALVTLVLLLLQWQLTRAIDARQGEIGGMQRALKARTPALRPLAGGLSVAEEIERAKAVIQQLLLPWEHLFAAIEASDSKGIALLSIQPDAEKRLIVIGGEAKTFEMLLDYIRQLERSQALLRVHLTSHEIQKKDPQHPIRFAIAAEWGAIP